MARSQLTIGLFALLAAGVATAQVGPPPVDAFYTQRLDAGGIPVLGSAQVPAEALRRARDIVDAMLADRADLRAEIVRQGVRVAVMAESEGTTDLPEQRDWKKPVRDDPRLTPCERKHYDARIGRLTDTQYWNARARGMGGPLTSVGAENLLGKPGTRYFGESILVHEFAHAILRAVAQADPGLYAAVGQAYRAAIRDGRWRGEYAAVSVEEYWAIGTQIWFESSRLVNIDGRRILTPAQLGAYDPALHAALGRVHAGHHIAADIFWRHPARIPPGPPPANTAEVC